MKQNFNNFILIKNTFLNFPLFVFLDDVSLKKSLCGNDIHFREFQNKSQFFLFETIFRCTVRPFKFFF